MHCLLCLPKISRSVAPVCATQGYCILLRRQALLFSPTWRGGSHKGLALPCSVWRRVLRGERVRAEQQPWVDGGVHHKMSVKEKIEN